MVDLLVQEVFGPTIQGEGAWFGSVVSFIRLYGCPVGCPWCDTGYADGGAELPRQRYTVAELVEGAGDRVVVSGGEPFAQSGLPGLVNALIESGMQVHIETSGAVYRDIHPEAWITLSPKHHVSPRYPVALPFWERCNEVKVVIQDGQELDFYAPFLPSITAPVFLQPEHSSPDSLRLTLDLLYANPTYRLSLQSHKLIGVR